MSLSAKRNAPPPISSPTGPAGQHHLPTSHPFAKADADYTRRSTSVGNSSASPGFGQFPSQRPSQQPSPVNQMRALEDLLSQIPSEQHAHLSAQSTQSNFGQPVYNPTSPMNLPGQASMNALVQQMNLLNAGHSSQAAKNHMESTMRPKLGSDQHLFQHMLNSVTSGNSPSVISQPPERNHDSQKLAFLARQLQQQRMSPNHTMSHPGSANSTSSHTLGGHTAHGGPAIASGPMPLQQSATANRATTGPMDLRSINSNFNSQLANLSQSNYSPNIPPHGIDHQRRVSGGHVLQQLAQPHEVNSLFNHNGSMGPPLTSMPLHGQANMASQNGMFIGNTHHAHPGVLSPGVNFPSNSLLSGIGNRTGQASYGHVQPQPAPLASHHAMAHPQQQLQLQQQQMQQQMQRQPPQMMPNAGFPNASSYPFLSSALSPNFGTPIGQNFGSGSLSNLSGPGLLGNNGPPPAAPPTIGGSFGPSNSIPHPGSSAGGQMDLMALLNAGNNRRIGM